MLGTLALVMLGVFSCQKTIDQNDNSVARLESEVDCTESPYNVVLISNNVPEIVGDVWTGNYEWTWKITKKAESKDLSNFSVIIPTCVPPINIVSASRSTDGSNFSSTGISTTLAPNPSLSFCDLDDVDVLKFDFGGDYYIKIVVDQSYGLGLMTGIYKSGGQGDDKCGAFCFQGMDCVTIQPPREGCSFSQGFWFAKPYGEENTWPGGGITMGGHTYTAAEARALWWVSGNLPLKRAFTQAATIKLSKAAGYLTDDSEVSAYVDQIDAALTKLVKLTPANITTCNNKLKASVKADLSNWAGAIGKFIDENHCELNPEF